MIFTFEYVKLERFRLSNIRITKRPFNHAGLCSPGGREDVGQNKEVANVSGFWS